jgi:putative DNA methylase
MKKRLIEWNLPLADISEESAREKNIRHGHPSTLHIWWARRPLASSRATAFAALIDDPGEGDPDEREYLMDLIRRITPWDAVKHGNSEAIEEARRLIRKQWGHPPRVLDPFAGGGSIPLETLRLGCDTYASDYNPVAVFIEKATLEWPQKYGIEVDLPRELVEGRTVAKQLALGQKEDTVKVSLLAYLVEKWADIILEQARDEIGHFYPPDPQGWIPVGYLWARTITCQNPACKGEIPLIRQFWLAKTAKKKIAYRPIVNRNKKQVDFEILEDAKAIKSVGFDPNEGTITRGDARCFFCGQVVKAKEARRLSREGKMGQRMIALILHHPNHTGKIYRIATPGDLNTFRNAENYLEEKIADWHHLESPIPDERISDLKGRINIYRYGLTEWGKLFNSRQILALVTFSEKILGSFEKIKKGCEELIPYSKVDFDVDHLTSSVIGYLGIIFSRQVDRTSSLARHDVTRESHQGTFARQALPFIWDYAEVSPFSGSTSDWTSNRDWVLYYLDSYQVVRDASSNVEKCSALEMPYQNDYFDAVLTDPPYYDNVPYADLSDFFMSG